jgi:hypothetical protein
MTLEERIKICSREELCSTILELAAKNRELKKNLKTQGTYKSEELRQNNRALADENDRLKHQLSCLMADAYATVGDEQTVNTMLIRIINGVILCTIAEHGDITRISAMSAAKRIAGTLTAALKYSKKFFESCY